jgi:DNA-binding NtrC family response regulator
LSVPNCSSDTLEVSTNTILLISPRNEDHVSLENIFRGSQWNLQKARTASDGLKIIRRSRNKIPVVICEHRLPDGDWKSLLAELEPASVWPSLIVCSRLADERLWVEVLNLGAYDLLLCAPFVPEEVLRVTESAWLAWSSTARSSEVQRKVPGIARSPVHNGAMALAAGGSL